MLKTKEAKRFSILGVVRFDTIEHDHTHARDDGNDEAYVEDFAPEGIRFEDDDMNGTAPARIRNLFIVFASHLSVYLAGLTGCTGAGRCGRSGRLIVGRLDDAGRLGGFGRAVFGWRGVSLRVTVGDARRSARGHSGA